VRLVGVNYLHWLIGASAFFMLAERVRPARRDQAALRPGFAKDVLYLLFNGHFYALWFGAWIGWFADQTRDGLSEMGWLPSAGLLDDAPYVVAMLAYLVISDLLQWCVHVLLHRVPLLWQFHKIHHSVIDMDWAGNFRFHWMELVVYRSLLYVPLLFLGGRFEALFPVWVFATFWGHFNHSNLNVGIGPLGWVLNSPRMHLWHHDASDEGRLSKNYGIVFSLWDFLFGTAYWPRERGPARLGFPGMEELPGKLWLELVWPLSRDKSAGGRGL